jgi:CubicO group peptidase (beta-lactamase class C family)
VDSFVRPLIDEKVMAGCVVGIVEDGKTEVYGYGSTNLDGGVEPDGDTIFEIGSVTKAITGTLLADMVNRGEIKLDAPLQQFMPEDLKLQEVEGHPIRIVDVAAQRSGLPRMPTNFAPKDPSNPYADYTSENMYAFLKTYKLERPPGEYEYSNLGVGLLGQILAKRGGKSYEALLIERICDPLEMNDTRVRLNADQQKRLAKPYDAALSPEHNWDLDVLVGAGGIRSSANDMLKFLSASLASDERPAVKAIHKAWEPVPTEESIKPNGPKMGLAWMIAGDGQTRWHNGQTGGYSAVIFANAKGKKAVVVLSNTSTDKTTAAGEKIIQAIFGMKPAPIDLGKSVAVAEETLQRYVGEYQLAPGAIFSITVEKGQLMAQLTGQPTLPVFAKSEKEFFYKAVDAQLTFEVNEKGEVSKLTLHQNGRDMPAAKVK